jgi:hypothetical protein
MLLQDCVDIDLIWLYKRIFLEVEMEIKLKIVIFKSHTAILRH